MSDNTTGIESPGASRDPRSGGPLTTSGPVISARVATTEERARSSGARLRQEVWEATQFLSYDEIREYVDAVLREVESDEP